MSLVPYKYFLSITFPSSPLSTPALCLSGSPFECGSHMSGRTPVWLNGPSKPVELISPNFPNAFNASNLECIWEVRARFGTKVSYSSQGCSEVHMIPR